MARINLEDQFFLDLIDLIALVPDRDKATGNVIHFMKFAQEQHKQGKLISETEFKAKGFLEELIGIFAERTDGGIKARGADKHFGWLNQKIEAGRRGGKVSASRPRDDRGRLTKTKRPPSTTKRKVQADVQANPSDHQPSISISISNSSSNSSSSEIPTESKPNEFVAAYCRKFKERWKVNPQVQGKDAGIALRLAKGMSFSRFEHLLEAYFQMPDSWLVKTKHPLAAFETKLNEVTVFADSGQFTTQRQAQQADDMASNHLLMEKLKREGR